jgi:hypothetical protein
MMVVELQLDWGSSWACQFNETWVDKAKGGPIWTRLKPLTIIIIIKLEFPNLKFKGLQDG